MNRVHYVIDGIDKFTDTVWDDSVTEKPKVWLVCNEFGVFGAVLTNNDATFETAYYVAVDEIAHDWGNGEESEAEIMEAIADGLATFRGSGVPSTEGRSLCIADTSYLTLLDGDEYQARIEEVDDE